MPISLDDVQRELAAGSEQKQVPLTTTSRGPTGGGFTSGVAETALLLSHYQCVLVLTLACFSL